MAYIDLCSICSMQALLKALREEHERSSSDLFEATSHFEDTLGARQREVRTT